MHPNDTLNGKLLEHERPEEKHLRAKLGYWQMVEERVVRAQVAARGYDPDSAVGATMIAEIMRDNHARDESYKVTSERFSAKGAAAQQARFERDREIDAARDAAIQALRQIAAGHNDPMNLAIEVLSALDALTKGEPRL